MTVTDSPATAPEYAAAQWAALGSYVSLVTADADRLAAAKAGCERLLAAVDRACSRFRADSDLVRANQNAGRWVRVDPLLCRAVEAAVRVAGTSDGLVDPTLGRQLVALGYDRDLDQLRPPESSAAGFICAGLISAVPALTDGWREIGIDPDGGLRVPVGVSLDLGATGKAFAADLIAATVADQAGTSLIISLGGDVAVGGEATHPWRIAVAERPDPPQQPGTAQRPGISQQPDRAEAADSGEAEIVVLEQGALATSSTLARRWRRGDTIMHHLLDPRTGLPVDPVWRTVSVCAATCLDANAASTAAIVMGARAVEWLERNDLAARLVSADGQVLRIAGWPEPDE